METKLEVTICIEGGLISEIKKPDNLQINVRDYDCEFFDVEDKPKTDEDGREYHETIYE